jgi:(p)ppGpp synthase/HD superfamily hydrolase
MESTKRIPSSTERLPKTRAALKYARELHAGQSREADGAPFIVHPREVAELLYAAGAPDELIAAGRSTT